MDISRYAVDRATAHLSSPIRKQKLNLICSSVDALPFVDRTFDKVFHCNSFYFWPSMQRALLELRRVMKPGALMVTVMSLTSVRNAQKTGLLKYGEPDPILYMSALELSGFHGVNIDYLSDDGKDVQAIHAYRSARPLDTSLDGPENAKQDVESSDHQTTTSEQGP